MFWRPPLISESGWPPPPRLVSRSGSGTEHWAIVISGERGGPKGLFWGFHWSLSIRQVIKSEAILKWIIFKVPFAPYMQWKARAIMGHYGFWWKVTFPVTFQYCASEHSTHYVLLFSFLVLRFLGRWPPTPPTLLPLSHNFALREK